MERVDPETGEVTTVTPAMPPEIAKALLAVAKTVKQLGNDDTNNFGKYGFVSIDKFLATFGPRLAEAGLIVMIDEEHVEVTGGGVAQDEKKSSAWLRARFAFTFYHESGVSFGPVRRTVMVPAVGAQAFGSAQSYLIKQFLRAVFFVPTGDKDADAEEGKPLPQAQRAPQTATADKPAAATIMPNEGDKARARELMDAIRKEIAQATTKEKLIELWVNDSTKANVDEIKRCLGSEESERLRKIATDRREALKAAEANAEPAI